MSADISTPDREDASVYTREAGSALIPAWLSCFSGGWCHGSGLLEDCRSEKGVFIKEAAVLGKEDDALHCIALWLPGPPA